MTDFLRNPPSGPLVDFVAEFDEQRFSTPGTYLWKKPAGARSIDLYLFPVGMAGGSGRNNGAVGGTNASGGSGGGTAGIRILRGLDPDLFADTVVVVVGANNFGGASIATGPGNGQAGTQGGVTSFGSINANGVAGAAGGTTIGGGTSAQQGNVDFLPAVSLQGGNGNPTGAGNSGSSTPLLVSPGAGSGGGIPTAGTRNNGGPSGSNGIYASLAGGVAAGSKNGQKGIDAPDGALVPGGAGSGGASSSDGSPAGDGGDGGFPSGPGGGGGASAGGGRSGAGGKGGGALVAVITRIAPP